METIHHMRLVAYSIVLFVCSTLERWITIPLGYQFDPKENWNMFFAYHIISLSLLVFLFFISTQGAPLIVHSEWLSKLYFLLFCKTKYVGGTWVEIVKKANGEIDHYSIVKIGYNIDKIYLDGATYKTNDPYFDRNYTLETKCSCMDNNGLTYTYIFEYIDRDTKETKLDHGTIKFDSRKGYDMKSHTYSGTYDVGKDKYSIDGFLIENKQELSLLKKDYKEALKVILDRLAGENPTTVISQTSTESKKNRTRKQ